jgi:hypothetical protein
LGEKIRFTAESAESAATAESEAIVASAEIKKDEGEGGGLSLGVLRGFLRLPPGC